MELLDKFFKSDFMPHGHCYFWKPEIVWTNAISDGVIALAYLTIPFTLVYIVRTRKDINYMSLILLFAIFILGCGATHVMDVINIWKPFYYIDSSLRVITALASIGTALMLVRITPKILVIPNPEEFKKINAELKEQLRQLEEKEKQLREREALLLETQEIGNIGSYDLDLRESKLHWTPQMYKIFGFDAKDEINYEKWLERIHPQDKEKVLLSAQKAYQNKDLYNAEYRILLPDNTLRYIWSRGKVH